jgi:isopenicillin-N N-acyltransferase-like protein
MHGGQLRVLEIFGDSNDLGRSHGLECRDLIRAYLEDRIGLSTQERWSGQTVDRDLILACATDTLEAHERYSPSLFSEITAMARAAGISNEEAVVVGGFTDLVDVVRARVGAAPTEDNCTAVINPAKGYLAQTWDMHASAGAYVIMLKLDPLMGPAVIVQTTAGCLGQMGMNEAGIGVGINNLTSYGKPGVTWPFVVRRVLEQTDLDMAVSVVLDADLAGGHNFLVMGPDGVGANIEAMPNHKRVTKVTDEPYVHTNHCLDPNTSEEEAARLEASIISSDKRLDIGYETADDLDAFFADPWISRRVVDQPHEVATCGAVVIEPGRRKMRSTWGVPGDNPWESFRL